jgi:hypothetical protein
MNAPKEEIESVNKYIPGRIALLSFKYPVLSNVISFVLGAVITAVVLHW